MSSLMNHRAIVVVALLGLFLPAAARALPPLPARVVQLGRQDDPLIRAGYLPVTFFNADPSGQTDSTDAINAAILAARESGLIAYVPAGTYLVSGSLVGVQRYQLWACADHFGRPIAGEANIDYGTGWVMRKAPSLVGPSSGPRPIIRLADGAPGFGDPNNPRGVIHMYSNGPGYGYEPGWWGQFDCGMGIHLRNLEVHLGSGNPGAVGVRAPLAQWSSVQNVRVVANGGFAGFQGVVQTRVSVGLDVVGGRFGIILELGSETIAGARLTDQTEAAVVVSAYSPATLVGVEIEKATGPAIVIDRSGTISGPQTSQLTVVDSRIHVRGGGAPLVANAANESAGRSLFLQDVWMGGGSGPLVQSGSHVVGRAAGSEWTHITRYAYGDPWSRGDVANASYANGRLLDAPYVELEGTDSAPADLRLRHELPMLPAFDAPGVVNVLSLGARGDGTTDDSDALQRAFDAGGYVFMPRGDYRISRTIVLRSNTRVFGVPTGRSRLVTYGFTSGEPMLRTVDDADATIFVSDLQLLLDGDAARPALDWRAGPASVVSELYADLPWTPDRRGVNRAISRFSGHGGGRFYGLQLFQQYDGASEHPDHRTVLIDGTSAPLTFYASNMEYSNAPMMEVRNAQNIRFIGGNKTEVRLAYLMVSNTRNFMHSGVSGHCQFDFGVTCNASRRGDFDLFRITGGDNLLLANEAMYPDSHHMRATLVDDNVAWVDGTLNVGYYERGRFDASVFPHCGDGVCDVFFEASTCGDCDGAQACGDGACSASETCDSCAADCSCAGTSATIRPCSLEPAPSGSCADADPWSQADVIALGPEQAVIEPALGLTEPPATSADLSAKAMVAWDTEALYVRVGVTDERIEADAREVYERDSVELYLDGDGDRATSYGSDDWQITVGVDGAIGGVRGAPSGTVTKAERTTTGYAINYVVPWAALGGPPSVGHRFGFDLAVNDNDGAGRTTQIVLTRHAYGFLDTSGFEGAELEARACTEPRFTNFESTSLADNTFNGVEDVRGGCAAIAVDGFALLVVLAVFLQLARGSRSSTAG